MLFSSPIFLYFFLPLTLLVYYLIPKKIRNSWLLITSLIFFAWGGVSYTIILVASIILNYFFGRLIQKNIGTKKSRQWLIIGVSSNLLILGIFKYANFFTQNINILFDSLSLPNILETEIILPIGISFYTFHSLSYLIDIYRGKTLAQVNIFDLSLYVCMFSQLVAGPIIRYSDVWQQIRERTSSLEKFSSGVERFLIGLAKKVLIANTLASVADSIFESKVSDIGALNAWLGISCYTLQIYCDFSGYSDMAIGLGRMFGFNFKENFDFPYLAKSLKEFWRHWHISLSSFFRDYVYIPLGGNRVKISRQYLNLILVFFLTGFWHGASWGFIIWGLFHGFFLLMERLFLGKILEKTWKPLANFYTLLVVMFAWVLFRADTLNNATNYWKAMFDFKLAPAQFDLFYSFINSELITVSIIAILGSFGFFKLVKDQIEKLISIEKTGSIAFAYLYHTLSAIIYFFIFILSSMYLFANTYNPFIYYKF